MTIIQCEITKSWWTFLQFCSIGSIWMGAEEVQTQQSHLLWLASFLGYLILIYDLKIIYNKVFHFLPLKLLNEKIYIFPRFDQIWKGPTYYYSTYFTEYPFSFQSNKAEKIFLLFLFPDALTDLVGDEYLVTGENATAGIWATYPTQGISTVN